MQPQGSWPKPKYPILADGVLARGHDGNTMPGAGTLPAQGRVTVGGRTMRFDDHAGISFALVMRSGEAKGLSAPLTTALKSVGVRFVVLAGGSRADSEERVIDTDGVYARTLDSLAADVLLIRPDSVLFGHADRSGLPRFAETLLQRLHCSRFPASKPVAAA